MDIRLEQEPDDIKVSLSIFLEALVPDPILNLPDDVEAAMSTRIEDYALIGDCRSAALVGARRLDRLAVLAAF